MKWYVNVRKGLLIVNINEIGEFYKSFVTSELFTEDLQDKIRHIRDEQEYRKFISKYVIPKASEKGHVISVDDILQYEKIMLNSLSEDELENIAGGKVSLKAPVTLMLTFTSIFSSMPKPYSAMENPSDREVVVSQ